MANETQGELAQLIAACSPDTVVLLANRTTQALHDALISAGYVRDVRIEPEPQRFFENIEHFAASGDIILAQNDLPDSYS